MKVNVNLEKIKTYINDKNLSKGEFCKLCDISYHAFYNILNRKNYSFQTLFKISRVLNTYMLELLTD